MFGAAVEMSFILESVSLREFWIRIKLHHKYYYTVLWCLRYREAFVDHRNNYTWYILIGARVGCRNNAINLIITGVFSIIAIALLLLILYDGINICERTQFERKIQGWYNLVVVLYTLVTSFDCGCTIY